MTEVKRYALYVSGGLILLVGAFAAGRYSRPARVEYTQNEVIRYREVRTVVYQRITDTHTITRRVVVTAPDGSSRSEETADTKTHEDSRTTENDETARDTKTQATKIVTADKNWQVYLLGAASLSSGLRANGNVYPVVGVTVGRRLLGPVWGAVSADSSGRIGVGVGLGF